MSTQVRAAQDVQQDGLVGVVKVSKEGIFLHYSKTNFVLFRFTNQHQQSTTNCACFGHNDGFATFCFITTVLKSIFSCIILLS